MFFNSWAGLGRTLVVGVLAPAGLLIFDLFEGGAPVSPRETLWRVYSMTKPVTAQATGRMARQLILLNIMDLLARPAGAACDSGAIEAAPTPLTGVTIVGPVTGMASPAADLRPGEPALP